MKYFGGMEAGGTKIVCAVADETGSLLDEIRYPTTVPGETVQRAIDYFQGQPHKLEAIGIGSFGPLDLHPGSPTYGQVTQTPKPGWSGAPLAGPIREAMQVPVVIDTDVNAAAIGENLWGAAQGLDTFIYLTIGTGIGGGVMAGGKLLHGLVHPEMGHIRIPHADLFPGVCPFHGDCFEGLAAGPAIQARWGAPAQNLPADHEAWQIEAEHIAQALHSFVCGLSPQRIILGGGVMEQQQLFPLVRSRLAASLNGYVRAPQILEQMDAYVVPPGLGNKAGVLGSVALAMKR